MSKSTKIIAALGVVAGLGVAALPMATFADYTPQSVSGNVDIYVEIPEAIAMTIAGNNDDNTLVTTAGATGVDVFSPTTGDPSTVDGHARPMVCADDPAPADPADCQSYTYDNSKVLSSSYASLTQNAVVDSSNGSASAADQAFKSTITVYTNSTKGYNLTISPVVTATDPSIVYGSTALINQTDNNATIPAGTSIAAGTSNWAYKVGLAAKTAAQNDGTNATEASVGNWTALTAAAPVIDTINAPTSNGRITTVYYGVSTATDQAAGLYKGSVTYTATTKNS